MKDHLIRLQKFIADCGVASRRKAEEFITEGRVRVNDEVVTVLGTKIDPKLDIVQVDENILELTDSEKVYLVLNKPRGYVTTVHDPEGRDTVMDLCKNINLRIFPVGRLDYLSEGLLLLTNDGALANIIAHPRFQLQKVYEVKVFGRVNDLLLKSLRAGVRIDGELLKPKSVRVIEFLPKKTWLEFRLTEGKNREIRRICETLGLTIDKLKRVAIEGLKIDHIKPGQFELVTKRSLLKDLGIDEEGNRTHTTEFKSQKKTVTYKQKKKKNTRTRYTDKFDSPMADSPGFQRYRKENYYKTIAEQKRKKAEAQAKIKEEKEKEKPKA